MKKKVLENKIRDSFINESLPDKNSINNKIYEKQYQSDHTKNSDIIIKVRSKDSKQILAIACFIILLITLICVPILINHFGDKEIGESIKYFDGSNAEWEFNIDLKEYNSKHGTKVKGSVNYKGMCAVASNIDGYFWLTYYNYDNGADEEIKAYVMSDNRLPEQYRNYEHFSNKTEFDKLSVLYQINALEYGMFEYKMLVKDSEFQYIYVIDIMSNKDDALNYYLNELQIIA